MPVEAYIEDYKKSADAPDWITPRKDAAIARFEELGFPGFRDEEWRLTNLTELLKTDYTAAPRSTDEHSSPWDEYLDFTYKVKLVNGYITELPESDEHVSFNKIDYSNDDFDSLVDKPEHTFSYLNTALANDVLFIEIKSTDKVQILVEHSSISKSENHHSHPRVFIQANKFSDAAVVESFCSTGKNFVNTVTEIFVNASAHFDHCKIQDESPETNHIAALYVRQKKDSRFRSHVLNLGAKLNRNNIYVDLDEVNCECTMNGLYLGKDQQQSINHTELNHKVPHCNSWELYKGILDDKASADFKGRINVFQDAQKTDAVQTNRALLLSDDARVNTKPQLEIFADDVKCTHGATIGQLDEKSMFYLQARGIDKDTARAILTAAFAAEAIADLPFTELRRAINAYLLNNYGS